MASQSSNPTRSKSSRFFRSLKKGFRSKKSLNLSEENPPITSQPLPKTSKIPPVRPYIPTNPPYVTSYEISLNLQLHREANRSNTAKVLLLLDQGADINSKSSPRDETILLKAAKRGDYAFVQFLLRLGSSASTNGTIGGRRLKAPDPNAKDVDDWTVLDWAVVHGHTRVVKQLVDVVADIECPDSTDNWTILHRAAFRDNEDIVRLLLDRGARISARDTKWFTPLHRAALAGHERVVKLLLERGAEVDARDGSGWTALHNAALRGHAHVVDELLKYKPDIKQVNYEGDTAKAIALRNGKIYVSQMLEEEEKRRDPSAGLQVVSRTKDSHNDYHSRIRSPVRKISYGGGEGTYLDIVVKDRDGRQQTLTASDPAYW